MQAPSADQVSPGDRLVPGSTGCALPAPVPMPKTTLVMALGMAFALATAGPTHALAPAKAALDDLRALATQAGWHLSARGIDTDERALILQSVTLTPIDGATRPRVTLGSLRIAPQDDGQVALIPSARGSIAFATAHGGPRHVETRHEGALFYRLDEGTDASRRLNLSVDFPYLSFFPAPGTEPTFTDEQEISAAASNVAGGLQLVLGAQASLSGRLTLETLAYRLDQAQTAPLRLSQTSDAQTHDVTLEFDFLRLDLLAQDPPLPLAALFDEGMRFGFSLEAAHSESRTHQRTPFLTLMLDTDSGASGMGMALQDGIFTLDGHVTDLRLNAFVDDLRVDLSAARSVTEMRLPLLPGTAPERFEFGFAMHGLSLSPETLQSLNAGSLASETADIDVAASAGMRIHTDLFEPGLREPPLELSELALDRMVLRLGSARLGGMGNLTLDSDVPLSEDSLANATGTFTFELEGGEALLDTLAADGFMDASDLFFARMMVNMLGRSLGPDHYQSEIDVAPGGELLINGLPLPF